MTRWTRKILRAAPLFLGAGMLALASGCENTSRTPEDSVEPASPTPAPSTDLDEANPPVVGSPSPVTTPSPPAEGVDSVDDSTVKGPAERAGERADEGLNKAGEKIREGAKEAGSALQRGAEKTESALERGAEKSREAVQEGADKVKEAVDPGEATGEEPPDDTP